MPESKTTDIKADAHRIIDGLPNNATWDDVMYRVYVRQCIDAGIKDSQNENVIDVDDVRKHFGLGR